MDEIVLARMCALAIVQNEKEKVDNESSAVAAVRELADLGPVSFTWMAWTAQGVDIDNS